MIYTFDGRAGPSGDNLLDDTPNIGNPKEFGLVDCSLQRLCDSRYSGGEVFAAIVAFDVGEETLDVMMVGSVGLETIARGLGLHQTL